MGTRTETRAGTGAVIMDEEVVVATGLIVMGIAPVAGVGILAVVEDPEMIDIIVIIRVHMNALEPEVFVNLWHVCGI